MLKIRWKLDDENGTDPSDPTGEIYLSSGSAGVIMEEYTYLDSWFDALTEGLLAARNGIPKIIEILEEPDPLRFELIDRGGVRIAYKDQRLEITDPDHAMHILRESARAFLSEFGEDDEMSENTLLVKLKAFSEKEFRASDDAEPEENSDMISGRKVA